MSTPRIALLIGSSRQNGNCAGIAAWVSALLDTRLNGPDVPKSVEIVTVDPTHPPYPLGPVVDGTHIPAQVRDASKYASPAVQEWSRFVASCAAFVIVTPQYNWGYPGELKNALDHLYHEWSGKPVAIVTYGGHGGGRCAAQLQIVLGGGLKMQVLEEPVGISLPESYVRSTERVTPGDTPEFLLPYVDAINRVADQLREKLDTAAAPQ